MNPDPAKKNLREVVAMVVDQGLFVELACKLGETFGKVYYHCPNWTDAFPRANRALIGMGMSNIELAKSMLDPEIFDSIDIFIFPDVNFGHEQEFLVSQGKLVWGSRMGEDMELDRPFMKDLMKQSGFPVGGWRTVQGMSKLREYLATNKDKHVKVSRFRGTFETFKSPNLPYVEPKLDEVEASLGALKDVMEFVVEDDLPNKVEFGEDMYCIDGVFPTQIIAGPEIKDEGFVGVFKKRSELPEPLTRFDRVMAPHLKKFGYRGFYSTEVRIGKDLVPYMIDFCARAASPPNELYQEFYTNLAEIIWMGANGVCIDPKPAGRYGAEALIHSSWADTHWQPLTIPDSIKKYVKLRNAMRIDGKYYTAPQGVSLPEIGAVVGYGNTLQEAIDMVKKVADQVKGYYIEIKVDAFDRAEQEIAKGEKFGLKIF